MPPGKADFGRYVLLTIFLAVKLHAVGETCKQVGIGFVDFMNDDFLSLKSVFVLFGSTAEKNGR